MTAVLTLHLAAPALADVMAFGPDGAVRTSPGWTFHGRQAEEAGTTPRRAAPQPARADVLLAIAATAERHAAHPAIARLGMDRRQWGHLFRAMIEAESAYRPDAVSPKGAYGLGQLMPATARELGVDREDPAQNLDGAARYLVAQMDRFGSAELALAAYNAGPHRVVEYGGVPPFRETRAYVKRIAAIYERLAEEAPPAAPAAAAPDSGTPRTMAFTAVETPAAPSADALEPDARPQVSRRSAVVFGLSGHGGTADPP